MLTTPVAVLGAFVVLWLRRTILGYFVPSYMIQIENDVYSQIGLVMLTGISAPEATSVDVTFSFPSLLIPGTIGIAISLANVTGGADLGLNLFDSPDIGSSDNLMALANFGSGLAIASFDPGNLYLIIETQQLSEVPEPSTLGLLGAGMAALAAASLRRPLGTRGRRCASAHVVRRSSTSATDQARVGEAATAPR